MSDLETSRAAPRKRALLTVFLTILRDLLDPRTQSEGGDAMLPAP